MKVSCIVNSHTTVKTGLKEWVQFFACYIVIENTEGIPAMSCIFKNL